MKLSVKYFNKPRPRWARATSKFVRAISLLVGTTFFVKDDITGVFITSAGGILADYILDMFAPEDPTPHEVDPTKTDEEAIIN